jgi:hypothetical protein
MRNQNPVPFYILFVILAFVFFVLSKMSSDMQDVFKDSDSNFYSN